jgi:ERF superfamily
MEEVTNGSDPLALALVSAQLEMPELEKNAVNPHFKNRFMSLDNLIAKTRPVLNKHGLAIAQFPTVSETGGLVLTTVLLHGESGERLEFDTPLLGGAENMQQLGAAITYARRYAWQAVLGVAAEEDTDGETTKTAARKKPAAKAITRDQQRRLFAIAGENGVSLEVLREIVVGVTGAESTSAIPVDRYEEIVALVKDQSVPFDEKEAGRMNTIEQPEPNEVETVETETEEQENEEEQQPDEEPAEEKSKYTVPASVREHEQKIEDTLLEYAEPVDTPGE